MAILNKDTTIGDIEVLDNLYKHISISSMDDLDNYVNQGQYRVTFSSSGADFYLYIVGTNVMYEYAKYQVIFGPIYGVTDFSDNFIHFRTGFDSIEGGGFSWLNYWTHELSVNGDTVNQRITSWSSVPPATGSYKIYSSSGAPSTSYSTWAVTQFEAGASTDNPSTRYFIQIAMLGNSTSSTTYDLWYRKCSHNGTSWTNGTWYKIWNANNDGSGSTLDADRLDGRDSNNFIHSVVSGTSTGASVFNTTTLGFAVVNSTTNAPNTSCNYWGYLNLPCYSTITSTTYVKQIAYPYEGNTSLRGKIYVRGYSNGTWTAWNEIGSGSNILYGSQDPSSSEGANGDIYIKVVN